MENDGDFNDSTSDCSKDKSISINTDIEISEHIDDAVDDSSTDIVEQVMCETSKY